MVMLRQICLLYFQNDFALVGILARNFFFIIQNMQIKNKENANEYPG